MVSNWKSCKLEDVLTLHYGKSLPEYKRIHGNIPVYSSAGLTGYHNEALIPTEGLIIGRKGTIGKVYKSDTPFFAIDTTYFVAPKKEKYDLSFIYYLLQTLGFENLNEDSAVPGLNRDTAYSQNILMPSVDEQKAIAEILSSLDDKIDLLHRQNKTLESLAETLFRQWFVEEAGADWEKKAVLDIADHIKINIKPSENASTLFYHYSLPAFDQGKIPVCETGSSILSDKYQVLPNSILVSKLNPKFPRIWMTGKNIEVNSICSTEFQVFVPKNIKLFVFLFYLLKSAEAKQTLTMAASGTSGSHQRVTPKDILKISFKLPNLQKAIDFSTLVQPSLDKINQNEFQISSLTKLRNMLLPKLINGEVLVSFGENG